MAGAGFVGDQGEKGEKGSFEEEVVGAAHFNAHRIGQNDFQSASPRVEEGRYGDAREWVDGALSAGGQAPMGCLGRQGDNFFVGDDAGQVFGPSPVTLENFMRWNSLASKPAHDFTVVLGDIGARYFFW